MLSFANGGSPLNAPYPTVLAEYNDVEGTLALIDQNAGALRERATRYGIVLIFDEVMTSRISAAATAIRFASVPELQNRTSSTEGKRWQTISPSRASFSLGPPEASKRRSASFQT
jgi:hypothetical protein